jgi:hypothetical protein
MRNVSLRDARVRGKAAFDFAQAREASPYTGKAKASPYAGGTGSRIVNVVP